MDLALKVLLAYLLGSVVGSLVIGRLRGGVDIRKLGSGNAGGTNALRTQGKAFAFWVMAIDIGKGILAAAVLPALPLFHVAPDPAVDRDVILYAVAFAAIVGHVFPVWFGFRGGKGGATAAGLLIYLAPPALAFAIIGGWLLVVLVTGYVGLATISAAALAAVLVGVLLLPEESGLFAFALATATLLIYAHRGNIQRMLNGTESRFARPLLGRLLGGK
jgi:glycerol-3-phosphate acyltransferase PlsY